MLGLKPYDDGDGSMLASEYFKERYQKYGKIGAI